MPLSCFANFQLNQPVYSFFADQFFYNLFFNWQYLEIYGNTRFFLHFSFNLYTVICNLLSESCIINKQISFLYYILIHFYFFLLIILKLIIIVFRFSILFFLYLSFSIFVEHLILMNSESVSTLCKMKLMKLIPTLMYDIHMYL